MLASTPSGWPLAQQQASKVHRHLDAPPLTPLLAAESLGLLRGINKFEGESISTFGMLQLEQTLSKVTSAAAS